MSLWLLSIILLQLQLSLLLVSVVDLSDVELCVPAGCIIPTRDAPMENPADMIMLMERVELNDFQVWRRRLDSKIRQSCLLQKGVELFEPDVAIDVDAVGVDICFDSVEMVGSADSFHLTGVVNSGAVSSDIANMEVPILQPGHARLWDVASSMRASRLPVLPTSDMTLAWKRLNTELEGDINKEYLLDGVMNGFLIVDRECDLNNISEIITVFIH
jgi:hypothetical protein